MSSTARPEPPEGRAPAAEAAEHAPAAEPPSASSSQAVTDPAVAEAEAAPEIVPPESARSSERLVDLKADLKAVGTKLLKDPIGGVQQVVEALGERRGVALGWAAGFILTVLCYLVDLGAGSLWNGDDALLTLAAKGLHEGTLRMVDAMRAVPPPTGVPLGLWELAGVVGLFGHGEAAMRLLPALAALGCALCLLTIAIDVGVGRHAGGLGGIVLLGMPLTYELSHRAVPDMLIAFAATGAIALTTHCLHGHKFDRHVLPHHSDEEAPRPLPLRRWTMALAAVGIGAAALVDPRAGVAAIAFAVLDILLSHRPLLRKRRVWAALGAATILTVMAAALHPGGLRAWLRPPADGTLAAAMLALWRQGESWYGRHIGPVVIIAAGFGLLLGSLRRASRPLLCWVVVTALMSLLGDTSPPPRGLGLVLPPLALCAAVGFESPVRWLGHLGMVVTSCALAGIVLAVVNGGAVLHRYDTIKALSLSQRRAPEGALLCTVGVPTAAPTLYTGRKVVAFATAREVYAALGPDQPLSCLMPPGEAQVLQRLIGRPQPPQVEGPKAPPAEEPRGRGRKKARAAAPAGAPAPPVESVLATVLDIEEPPPDTAGPRVVLVSR